MKDGAAREAPLAAVLFDHLRSFVDFLRAELDRVGPEQADLCHDFFRRAVALELSFFEAAYAERT